MELELERELEWEQEQEQELEQEQEREQEQEQEWEMEQELVTPTWFDPFGGGDATREESRLWSGSGLKKRSMRHLLSSGAAGRRDSQF